MSDNDNPPRDRVVLPTIETPTLTKAELADLLFERLGLNKRESKDMVEAFFEIIHGTLVKGEDVKLSPKEYELLRVLVQHAGKVLTHKFLLGELWDTLTDAQYLRVYVRQLRQKIEADPERPQYVLTETGIGYRLRAPD